MAKAEKGVKFVGRLASYKYFNMDQAMLENAWQEKIRLFCS